MSTLAEDLRAQTAPAAAEGGAVALPAIDVAGAAAGAAGGEGAGAPGWQSPAEKEGYSAPPILATTTKINVPSFDLPIAVQTVPEQVIIDQNAVTI